MATKQASTARQGRPKKEPTLIQIAAKHTDPRKFLIEVMNDESVDIKIRIDAAKAVLPYEHVRKGDIGKKQTKLEEARSELGSGPFAPAPPPLGLQ